MSENEKQTNAAEFEAHSQQGRSSLVGPASKAALAVGADGILIEIHPNPAAALSDGEQSLDPTAFLTLMSELRNLAGAMGRAL